ncbi:MAG: hypothetical protein CM1200mP30_32700 [Pseudomonadota bacterium]|nr:MAG: hypothetical protein CM1200mP30_32700 [Pseudomonadota bacterium]
MLCGTSQIEMPLCRAVYGIIYEGVAVLRGFSGSS